MTYRYSQEAKERVAALGPTAITEFIEEVPQNWRETIYAGLPAIQGFSRPKAPAAFKAKQQRLVGHLIHVQAGGNGASDWKTFARIWEWWARLRLGDSFPQGDGATPDADAGLAFLNGLADLFANAAREDVERLFTFSGFPDHPETGKALGRFRPAAVLERDRIIEGLPSKLQDMDDRLDILHTSTREADDRLDGVQAAVVSLNSEVKATTERIAKTSGAIGELRNEIEDGAVRLRQVEKGVEALETLSREATSAISELSGRAATLEQGLQALPKHEKRWEELAANVAALSSRVAELSDGLTTLSGREEGWALAADGIRELADRVAALESVLSRGGLGGDARQRVRLLESRSEGPFVAIRSIGDAVEVVSSNFQAAGVVKGAAQRAAREVVAALVAGQMVQFSGSLADFLADACAAAVGGPVYHEWRVPVGLTSDELATECIDTIADKERDGSGCLVLKGANLSAFEVYGAEVRDVVVRRQFGGRLGFDGVALVASWAQGPAAFPDGGTLAELGPVLDTDALSWRGGAAKLKSMSLGRLTHDSWSAIEELDLNAPAPPETSLADLLKEAGFQGGCLWTRIANRAFAILRAMPGDTEESALHSVMTSWALPWAKAAGGPVEGIRRIADRELADLRANAML